MKIISNENNIFLHSEPHLLPRHKIDNHSLLKSNWPLNWLMILINFDAFCLYICPRISSRLQTKKKKKTVMATGRYIKLLLEIVDKCYEVNEY
jgi:hypothetical protein